MESTNLCDVLTATQTFNTNSCLTQVNCSAVGPCVFDLFDLVAFQPGGAFTYRLIQEWIVYHLNTANGRDPCPSCVTLELENADIIASNLITRICQPNSEIVGQYSATVVNSLISIFSAYNNGELGPGKCATDNEVYCAPQPDCGCTYTRGYWQSPRFRTYPYSSKKKSPDSVKDTCNWPSNSTDHKENDLVNCQISGVKITKWDVEHRTYKGKDLDTLGINKQWTNAMAQAIAFQLNLLNGACAVGCQHSEYISGQCELINQFYVADVYPFLQPNGQSCKVSSSTVIGTCGTACQSLCSELATLTACNMATVLESFNNGTNGIGPGHCESTPDGNVTRRGCCENCNCYSPACDPEIVYFASESSAPQTDDGLTLDEELDIAMLVFIIIGTLTVIGIGTMMCMWMRNPQSAFTMFMSKKFDAVTPVESKRGTFRFYN
jgi:hypothetical protein